MPGSLEKRKKFLKKTLFPSSPPSNNFRTFFLLYTLHLQWKAVKKGDAVNNVKYFMTIQSGAEILQDAVFSH